jgi:hypothetical protein
MNTCPNPNCKATIREDANFCSTCDAAAPTRLLKPSNTSTTTVLTSSIQPKYWMLIIAIAASIALIAIDWGLLIWPLWGYIGAFWLMKKGYFVELTGCALVSGGMAILLP